jgi:hypothetical protein
MRITVLGVAVIVGVAVLMILLLRHFGTGPDCTDPSTATPF